MTYPKYDNSFLNKKPSGSKKKSYDGASSASGSYQNFLDYLEKSGNTQILKNKLFKASLLASKQKNQNGLRTGKNGV